jgi:hypothetical protein
MSRQSFSKNRRNQRDQETLERKVATDSRETQRPDEDATSDVTTIFIGEEKTESISKRALGVMADVKTLQDSKDGSIQKDADQSKKNSNKKKKKRKSAKSRQVSAQESEGSAASNEPEKNNSSTALTEMAEKTATGHSSATRGKG